MRNRLINSVAPIRINDLGGWTDTWFAGTGAVLNLAVYPYVQCQMEVIAGPGAEAGRITIHVENYGDRYSIQAGRIVYDKHPLLEAAVAAMDVPREAEFRVNIFSLAPGGGSMGTSAAVSVALIGALAEAAGRHMTPAQVAAKAQEIETVHLKQQCGIQDQIASAYGGICFIEMHHYPHATVSQLDLPRGAWWELEQRLALIYIGNVHKSSEVHERVIRELEGKGESHPVLARLREIAHRGKDALCAGDLREYGRVMIANNEAQRGLNPYLVSAAAQKIMDVARDHDALGWKVNGAGGEGGSVTILSGPDMSRKRDMIQAMEALDPAIRHIPTYLSRYGLRIWEMRGPRAD